MKIECLSLGSIGANCYFLSVDGHTAVIDPGYKAASLEKMLDEYSDVDYILLTHRHADHLMAAAYVKNRTGAKLAVSFDDREALTDSTVSLSEQLFFETQEYVLPDIILNDGDIIPLGNTEIHVIAAPGHSVGGVCFDVGNVIFTGDTLFKENIGRTDLPTGDYGVLINSLKKLDSLPGDYIIYPGHGEQTTLEYERKYNPYFRF